MATLIKPCGTESQLQLESDYVAQISKLMGGAYLEHITGPDGKLYLFDEEAKFKQLPVNVKATDLLHAAGLIHSTDCLAGSLVIAEASEVEEDD